jgi:hypothetical protein
MSSTRQLRVGFPEPYRSVELLDWETRPEDFDRLCEFIIGRLQSAVMFPASDCSASWVRKIFAVSSAVVLSHFQSGLGV